MFIPKLMLIISSTRRIFQSREEEPMCFMLEQSIKKIFQTYEI